MEPFCRAPIHNTFYVNAAYTYLLFVVSGRYAMLMVEFPDLLFAHAPLPSR